MDSENKKSKKKTIIITSIILVILIVGAIGIYFCCKYFEENKSVGSSWGDTYFAYLKEATNENDNIKNAKTKFIDIEKENPIMVMSYEAEGKNYTNIYKINNENQVDKIVYTDPVELELLYNIQDEKYNWYLHQETENDNRYTEIKKVVENPEINEPDFTIANDEETTQEKLSGEIITLSKFDETFVKPNIEELFEVDISLDTDLKVIKEQVEKLIENYKKLLDIITEEIKNQVDNQVTNVENTKKEIEEAKEEIRIAEEEKAKKEAEEKAKAEAEAKKKAEEEAKKAASATISEKQAQRLVERVYGTKDPDTGFLIGSYVQCKVKDNTGKQYYLMRVSWLVDNSHWSTIDGIAIALDGKSWKKIDIYGGYKEGDTIKEVYSQGNF